MLENDPRAPAPSSLQIHLLGPFRIVVDGTYDDECRFIRRKPKLLVKLLALESHHQLHREQAMELLWPDSDPESASNSLHKAIHMARRSLEPNLESAADSHFIITQGQQILLRAPGRLWIDIEAFECAAAEAMKGQEIGSFETALTLYSGDLLPEDLYEDWAARRREQLRTTHQGLLAKLAGLYEAQGDPERSVDSLKKLALCDPTNEQVHRKLMSTYARLGNRHQALRQFEVCRGSLRRELDVEPEAATLNLHEQIVAGQIQAVLPVDARRDQRRDRAITSLAILPLVNSSADPKAEYLSDGITESIINNLSQLSGLRVMARSTVFRYKGLEIEPHLVGRDLQVQAVLTGRLLQLGDRLVIRTELIDTTDGAQLWGAQYDRRGSDVITMQEEIARQISEKLQLKLTGEDQERLVKRHTENTEAYHSYLKGRYCLYKRTEEGLKNSVDHFSRAIEIDPGYALAHAGLADSYTVLGSFGISALAPAEAFPKAKQAAMRALEIDETLAEAHASLAFCLASYEWDWEGAGREFRRAIELKPDCTSAHHWYGFEYLTALRRLDEALAEIELAHKLEPLSTSINTDLGFLPYLMRDYDRAINAYRKALELDQSFVYTHWKLGLAYEQKAMYQEAIAEFEEAIVLSSGSPQSVVLLGHAYAISGKREEALKLLAELHEVSKRRYVSSYRVAAIHLGLGDKDSAYEWLNRALEERDSWVVWINVDPVLDKLRSDPQFADLVRRVGLAQVTD